MLATIQIYPLIHDVLVMTLMALAFVSAQFWTFSLYIHDGLTGQSVNTELREYIGRPVNANNLAVPILFTSSTQIKKIQYDALLTMHQARFS
jgi:hypothetical protein